LSPIEQQAILIAVSVENSCKYCVAAHSAVDKNFAKADQGIVDALRSGGILPNAKLNSLIEFTREVVRARGFVPEEKLALFLQSGYSNDNVLEVIVGVAQKTLSNYTNHLAKISLDEQFASEKWQAS
jgi:AhpD family alkylhydroperoxidase